MAKATFWTVTDTESGEEWVEQSNWGPGVTNTLKGSHVSAVNKFQTESGITRDLYSLVHPFFKAAYPHWDPLSTLSNNGTSGPFEVGNTIVTVPKNSKTDRVIAVEPGLNLWFQKGIGRMIRRRLLRVGIDLTDQSRNQRLARIGSMRLGPALATVDFSSASDSISRELVRELLPPRWFAIMSACRSSNGLKTDGSILRWEKFSSMGNGFTFELESLIFYAAATSVCEYIGCETYDVNVYGDDVIIPSEAFDLFSSFSAFLGFTVNQKKSFSSSPFRESCGAHYFDGVDIKPIFLKEKLQNVQSIFKLANSIRWLSHRYHSHGSCDRRFRACWIHLFHRVPKPIRLCIPVGIGDCGFISNFDEATPVVARDGIEGYLTDALIETGIPVKTEEHGLFLTRLKAISSDNLIESDYSRDRPDYLHTHFLWLTKQKLSTTGYGNTYNLRGKTKLKCKKILVHQWYNLGSWL